MFGIEYVKLPANARYVNEKLIDVLGVDLINTDEFLDPVVYGNTLS